jgi:signal transduction histidine kinase/CheY-like chemotaxis protein
MPETKLKQIEREKRLFSPVIVFILCAVLTCFAWRVATLSSTAENLARFDRSANSLLYAFKSRMAVYTNALVYTRNLMNLKPDLTAEEFKSFVRGMNLKEEYPGIQSIGYIRRLSSQGLKKMLPSLPEKAAQILEKQKDSYDVVTMVERVAANSSSAEGIDLSESPVRLQGMNRAAETGVPVATDKVMRISETPTAKDEFFFLVFVPHYKTGAALDTPEQRKNAILGFVYAGFLTPYLFGSITGDAKLQDTLLLLRIFDGPNLDSQNLIYAKGDLATAAAEYNKKIELKAAEHQWTILLRATTEFAPAYSRLMPFLILLVGMLLTVAMTLSARKGQQYAEQLLDDIRIQRKAEEQLSQARAAADEANRAKSLFLANVSHEIRTPLGIMLGFAELTEENKNDPDLVEHNMRKIIRNGRELTRIVGEVLDLSKIEANALLIEDSHFSLARFFDDLGVEWQELIHSKKLRFEMLRVTNFPEKVTSDVTRLNQILVNLLSNALKFTESGFIRMVVSYKEEAHWKGQLEVSIEDSGIGISDSQQVQLFKTFSQGDSSITRRFGGSGLGLALSKQLAKALGGELVLTKSQIGKGSCFTLKLPVGISNQLKSDSKKSLAVNTPINLNAIRVLLVEDSVDNRLLISTFLNKANAIVETANNGEEGVQKALSSEYSVVLMDIQMPVLDGYGAFEKLKAAGYNIPVIALTAHALIEEKEKAIKLGFFDYLTKPVNRHTLVSSIVDAVEV